MPAANLFRRMAMAILAAALVALLVATQAFAVAAAPRKKVVFWNLFTAGDSQRVVVDLVKRFNDSSTEYSVEQVDVPYQHVHQKMLPAIAGQVPPDVAIFDRFLVASYAGRGAFIPLDEFIRRDGLRGEDFFRAPWEECFYGGRQYAVPYDTDVRVLYYNKKLFREAGLDPERPPRTWSELREYSRKLTRKRPDGHLDQVGYVPIWGNTTLYLYGWQKGGRFMSPDGRRVTLNDPKIVEALDWVRGFVDEYGIESLMGLSTGFGAESQNPFITGRIAMIVLDVGELSTIQKYGARMEWGAAACPYADDGVPATWSGGFSLVIPRGARYVDGAWAFSKFILSDASQRYMATSSNKLPARLSAADDPFFRQSEFWRLAIDQMQYSHYRPITPVGAAIGDEMWIAVDQVTHGKMTSKAALDVATRESQKILDQFNQDVSGRRVNWTLVSLALGGAVVLLLGVRAWSSYRRIRATRLHRWQAAAGYFFALPAILGLLVFTVGPILAAVLYGFTHYEILAPPTYVGLENYRKLFVEDRYFLTALWNTFCFTIFSVPLGIAIALGLALLLNRPIAGRPFYRTFFYLPTVVPAVAGSLLWAWLFNGEYGLINVVLEYLGDGLSWVGPIPDLVNVLGGLGRLINAALGLLAYLVSFIRPVPWLTSDWWSKPALVIMGLWGVGGGMIIFLAALQGVPRTLYEAARIDGAGPWATFTRITLPMISPALFFMVVMGVIGSLQVFTQAYLVTNGGPLNSTLFYVLYLYREAFQNLHMGYASAMAWVLFVVILLLTGLQFALAKRWVYYEGGQP